MGFDRVFYLLIDLETCKLRQERPGCCSNVRNGVTLDTWGNYTNKFLLLYIYNTAASDNIFSTLIVVISNFYSRMQKNWLDKVLLLLSGFWCQYIGGDI